MTVPELLDRLEDHYGKQAPLWPREPYDFIIWWHSGYPQSDDRCSKGWAALSSQIGADPKAILSVAPAKLAAALKAGGMVPELRALRMKEVAMRVQDRLRADLRAALAGPITEARKTLKGFPGIADPGVDRILLFAGIAPVAAIPSNNVSVVIRVLRGRERENYGANYRDSQQAVDAQVPRNIEARSRAYLLLKRHGQDLCKRTNPKCDPCPVRLNCAYFSKKK
jgi:endonuclease-3